MLEIEQLIEQKKWARARELIQEELVAAPTDHWLWMTLGLTYYEQKQYEKALQCAKRAVELQPDCSLALWHYAGSLFMSGREDSALAIWTILLDMDLEQVAYGECGEGMDWALQLINDVHYRIGRYYQWKEDHERAAASFTKYLHNRRHGVGSLYEEQPVEEYLKSTLPALPGNTTEPGASTKRTLKS
jgi:tetratricopeptide (TPR) repeat protein